MNDQKTPETQVQDACQVKRRQRDEPVAFDSEFIGERGERKSSHDGKWIDAFGTEKPIMYGA